MTGRDILTHAGTVSHDDALRKAGEEYEAYRQRTLNEPSPVEQHFVEAVEEAKRIEHQRKRVPGKEGK